MLALEPPAHRNIVGFEKVPDSSGMRKPRWFDRRGFKVANPGVRFGQRGTAR
jgi:hypothetical protein